MRRFGNFGGKGRRLLDLRSPLVPYRGRGFCDVERFALEEIHGKECGKMLSQGKGKAPNNAAIQRMFCHVCDVELTGRVACAFWILAAASRLHTLGTALSESELAPKAVV